MIKKKVIYICENCGNEYNKEKEAHNCCIKKPKYFLSEKEKEIVVRFWRQEYGIPDFGGWYGFFNKKLPEEIMDTWHRIFPNDWERYNRKKTILKYPTWKRCSEKNTEAKK